MIACLVPDNAPKLIDIRDRRYELDWKLRDRRKLKIGWPLPEDVVTISFVLYFVHTHLMNISHFMGPELEVRKSSKNIQLPQARQNHAPSLISCDF